MEHEHDVPGAGPTRILLEDGYAPEVPHEVEAELRRPMEKKAPVSTRAELLQHFEGDFIGSTYDRKGCLQDWYKIHPELRHDLNLIADSIDPMVRATLGKGAPEPDYLAPRAREPDLSPTPAPAAASPLSPPPSRPTAVALGVSGILCVLLTCLLAALRTGGAIAWDWAWVLAPVWLPLVLGTIALAFLDERDAARKRVS